MQHYKNDPKKMSAKYSGYCPKCNERIKQGQTIYYWPSNRKAYCESCGSEDYAQFLNAAHDEAMYSGTFNDNRKNTCNWDNTRKR